MRYTATRHKPIWTHRFISAGLPLSIECSTCVRARNKDGLPVAARWHEDEVSGLAELRLIRAFNAHI